MDHALLAKCTGSTLANAAIYAKPLTECLDRWQINNPARISAFLANVTIETMNLAAVEEGLSYSTADRLREIFPSLFVAAKGGKYKAEDYVRNKAALSKLRYKGYHGRGLMHLTWLENYRAAGIALGFDYVSTPDVVMHPWHACATACWFWTDFRKLNDLADRGDLFEIRKIVNGPAALKLVETKRQRVTVLAALRAGDAGTMLA